MNKKDTNHYYYEVGWRLNRSQRQRIEDLGYHIYSTRSWDNGCGSTLERFVLVNHETDVITNFEALDPNDKDAIAQDYYEHMEKCDAEENYDFFKELIPIIMED